VADVPLAKVRAPTIVSQETRFAFLNPQQSSVAALRSLLDLYGVTVVEGSDFDAMIFSIRPADFVAFGGSLELPINRFRP